MVMSVLQAQQYMFCVRSLLVELAWRNCSVDHTATHTTGNSTIDTSETRDTQRPWSFCKTCDVAMKFVDDDDDDDVDEKAGAVIVL